MIVNSGRHENLKTDLCPKFVAATTEIENIIINPHEEKYVYKKFYGKMIEYEIYLKTFRGNCSCTQYSQCKSQYSRSSNGVNVSRICTKTYGRYIPYVEPTHKMHCTKP